MSSGVLIRGFAEIDKLNRKLGADHVGYQILFSEGGYYFGPNVSHKTIPSTLNDITSVLPHGMRVNLTSGVRNNKDFFVCSTNMLISIKDCELLGKIINNPNLEKIGLQGCVEGLITEMNLTKEQLSGIKLTSHETAMGLNDLFRSATKK
jgi:hypothetical protein